MRFETYRDQHRSRHPIMGRRYSTRRGRSPANAAWVVEYCGLQVECRDEADAKKIAGRLRRKGLRVTAHTPYGTAFPRFLDLDQLDAWLKE